MTPEKVKPKLTRPYGSYRAYRLESGPPWNIEVYMHQDGGFSLWKSGEASE